MEGINKKDVLFSSKERQAHSMGSFSLRVSEILSSDFLIESTSPKTLSEEQFLVLSDISSRGFWISMSQEDVRNHIFNSDIVYLIKEKGSLRWFSSVKFFKNLIYRYGTVIDSDLQWRWVYTELNKRIFEKTNIMFLRTQNMNIISAHRKTWATVLVWLQAEKFLMERVSEDEFSSFFWSPNFEDWIFYGAYGWFLWSPDRVSFITSQDYPWFSPEKWDALLVVIVK